MFNSDEWKGLLIVEAQVLFRMHKGFIKKKTFFIYKYSKREQFYQGI